ncbi:hypothetical protein JCM19275_2875 [Nonlabens ulvanivorans]|uniref:Uncharacterized protein n=1 Tax=Nonlabens ulvanivorans TaxID=906888 RepID=A0A090WCY1_NONUL|nr:hypothetical protein JCM19275_2875 [Nonlabens ulvanivorans]
MDLTFIFLLPALTVFETVLKTVLPKKSRLLVGTSTLISKVRAQ